MGLSLKDIVLLSDLVRLPKQTLKELCTDLDLDPDGAADLLAERLYRKMEDDPEAKLHVIESCADVVLAGRMSLTWFESTTGKLANVKNLLIRHSDHDPFEQVYIPPKERLTSDPYLFAAVEDNEQGKYILRFISKYGIMRNVVGATIERYPKTMITTVVVDENTGIVEVRTSPDAANSIMKKLGRMLEQQVTLGLKRIIAPFGYNVERIADALDGELIDTVSKPELLLEDFTQEQAIAVVEILSALDDYFKTDDIKGLESALNQSRAKLGDDSAATPFTVLILNGLEKVGLGAAGELRGLVLYDYLKPYLQHQGGYVRFEVMESGNVRRYTVRVGVHSNSIYFMTPATETAIQFVRDRIVNVV